MASSRGILLTLLQISLVTSFPHGPHHNGPHHNSNHHRRPKHSFPEFLEVAVPDVSPVNSYPLNSSPAPAIAASSPTSSDVSLITTSPDSAPTVSLPESPVGSPTSVKVTDTFTFSVIPTTSSTVKSSSDTITYTSTSLSLVVSSPSSTKTTESSSSSLVSSSKSSSTPVSTSPVVVPTLTSTATSRTTSISTTSSGTDSTKWPATSKSTSSISTSSTSTSSTSASLTSTSSTSTSLTSTSLTSTSSISTSSAATSSSSALSTHKSSTKSKSSTSSSSSVSSSSTPMDTSSSKAASRSKSRTKTVLSLTSTISTSTTVTLSSKTDVTTIHTTETASKETQSTSFPPTHSLTSHRKHSHKPIKSTIVISSTVTSSTSSTSIQSSTVISTRTLSTSLTSTQSATVTKSKKTKSIASSTAPALAPTFTSAPPVTLETTLTISEVQTLTKTTTVAPSTSGVVHTSLVLSNQNTHPPFRTTVVPTPHHKVKPITRGPNRITSVSNAAPKKTRMSENIFKPIATHAPPKDIPHNPNNPVPRLGIKQKIPIETNKFYFNFFSGSQMSATWTHPYSVAWVKGQGATGSWGISAVQIPENQKVFGPGDPPSYFINPTGLQPMILSARELGDSTALTMDNLEGFSCHVHLSPSPGAAPAITFPIVQGMGFVTGVYKGSTPMIQSSTFFTKLVYGGKIEGGIARYTVTLTDGQRWLIYVTGEGGEGVPTLTLASSGQIIANHAFHGTVQIGKVAGGHSLKQVKRIYDKSAGVYAKKGHIKGSVEKDHGSYTISWTKEGRKGKTLLMWALPHHIQSFHEDFGKHITHVKMQTTTKGKATAIHADAWHLHHNNLPVDMGFAPWTPHGGPNNHLSETAKKLIRSVAASELAEDFTAQTDLDSMYFSGKGLAKFAFAIYATNSMAKDTGLASAGLMKLKNAFSVFVRNEQINPLLYDTAWGGVVSSCTYTTGDTGCDFGNSIYNDHHFHYGYFVYTAAVIGHLDPEWLKQGDNKDWVNTLVRDYANPIDDDPYFPFQRMFDWFHGHSWAHGLFESADGKDQESSSEDTFSLYAIKMWGRVTGDENMEARGNLLLAVQERSLHNYYLLQNDNKVEPPNFIPNKAGGILFENKIDHTTYFGTLPEFIEGIHMLPVGPQTALTRKHAFIQQEWDTYFSNGRVDSTEGGWRGIIYAQFAIVDPVLSWNFFAQPDFDPAWLDGGASRTWYLAYCAALGGAPR